MKNRGIDLTEIDLTPPFLEALPILEKLENHGYEAYFVGGSVRDNLLGKSIHDVDIASSALPQEVKAIFKRTVDVGIEHGTVMVLKDGEGYEITTFRTESTYKDFRRPDEVSFVRSLREDLKRRDFTINALAMTKEGKVIDYFEGIKDLKERRIQAVGDPFERFSEDALRMMRAVRFQGQLGFDISQKTLEAIRNYAYLLEKIAIERIHEEFIKLMTGTFRNKAIPTLIETELYQHLPGLDKEKDALLEMGKLEKTLSSEIEVWGLLLYFIEAESEEAVQHFLKKWKTSNQVIKETQKVIYGLTQRLNDTYTVYTLYEIGLPLMLHVEKMLESLGYSPRYTEIQKEWGTLPIQSQSDMGISGDVILKEFEGKPGPWLGELLAHLEKQVVLGEVRNQETALIEESEVFVRRHKSQ